MKAKNTLETTLTKYFQLGLKCTLIYIGAMVIILGARISMGA